MKVSHADNSKKFETSGIPLKDITNGSSTDACQWLSLYHA